MEKNYFELYQKYKNKYISLKSKIEKVQTGGSQKTEVFLFKADWCPHCRTFLPQWEQLKSDHSDEYDFITYDSDKDSSEMQSWPIQGFPTIMVKKGKDVMEYVGPNEYNSVLKFIKNI